MNIRDIRCFLVSCETRNYTKTADQMFLSQQAVSRIISKLEDEIGEELFYRCNQTLHLTKTGEAFYETSKQMIFEYDSFIDKIRGKKEEKKDLRIAIPFGMQYLFPLGSFSKIMKEHKNVFVHIKEYPESECEKLVLNNEVDFAFCVNVKSQDLKVHMTRTAETCLMISNKNPLSKYDEVTIDQLKGERFITLSVNDTSDTGFVKSCQEAGVDPEIVFQSSDLQFIHRMCAENVGIGFYIGNPNVKLNDVKIVRIKGKTIYWDTYLISAKNKKLTLIEKQLLAEVKENWK